MKLTKEALTEMVKEVIQEQMEEIQKRKKPNKKKIERNPKGCPCSRDCCNKPDVGTPEHDHPEDGSFCEGCYGSHCENCGRTCYCDV